MTASTARSVGTTVRAALLALDRRGTVMGADYRRNRDLVEPYGRAAAAVVTLLALVLRGAAPRPEPVPAVPLRGARRRTA